MITCNICGGLGNQLMQIFNVIAYSIRYKQDFYFEKRDCYPSNTTRYPYWDTFLNELYIYVKDKKPFPNHFFIFQEPDFTYREIKYINYPLIKFVGYYQSYKYFQDEFLKICDMINIPKKQENIRNKYNDINNNINYENTISLHFRLGDYKKFLGVHPLCSYNYYSRSINYILQYIDNTDYPISILYFHENDNFDDIQYVKIFINTLKIEYPQCNFIEAPNEYFNDWEQLLLMSLCKYNIIANSTFSWWGAYLGNIIYTHKKITTYPDKWFGIECNNDTKDLFPENWIKIEC